MFNIFSVPIGLHFDNFLGDGKLVIGLCLKG